MYTEYYKSFKLHPFFYILNLLIKKYNLSKFLGKHYLGHILLRKYQLNQLTIFGILVASLTATNISK